MSFFIERNIVGKRAESQKWDEDDHGSKITAPTEP